MKKLFFLFVCAAIAAACSSEMEVPSPANPDDDMVEVSFNLAGDYVSVEETPLTRADEGVDVIYGVQILELMLETLRDEHTRPYAYGLFTDLKNARISLAKGVRYRFKAFVIRADRDALHNTSGITDKFIRSEDHAIGYKDYLITNNITSVDWYNADYKINVPDDGKINIDMERMSFSFTYNIVPPIDGSIKVFYKATFNDDSYEKMIYEVKAGADYKTEQVLYTDPRYTESNIRIQWERGNESLSGYTQDQVINIQKKKNYIINVDFTERAGENIGFNMDEEAFTDESYNFN